MARGWGRVGLGGLGSMLSVRGAAVADGYNVHFPQIVDEAHEYAVVSDTDTPCFRREVVEDADVGMPGFGEAVECPVDALRINGVEGL